MINTPRPGRSEFLEFSASNDDPLSQQSPARHPQPRSAAGAGSSAGQSGGHNRSPASANADGTSKRKGRSGKVLVPKITPCAGAKPKGRKGKRGSAAGLTTTPVLSPNHGQHYIPDPPGSVGINYPYPPRQCAEHHTVSGRTFVRVTGPCSARSAFGA